MYILLLYTFKYVHELQVHVLQVLKYEPLELTVKKEIKSNECKIKLIRKNNAK